MRLWFTRILATLFVLSLLASPQATVVAAQEPDDSPEQSLNLQVETGEAPSDSQEDEDDALNSGDNNQDSDDPSSSSGNDAADEQQDDADVDGDTGSEGDDQGLDDGGVSEDGLPGENGTPASDDETSTDSEHDVNADAPDNDEGQDEADSSTGSVQQRLDVGITNFNAKDVPLPTYDPATGLLTVNFTLNAGFSADEGEGFDIEYEPWNLQLEPSEFPLSVTDIEGLTAYLYPEWGVIEFVFEEGLETLGSPFSVSTEFAATVSYGICFPSDEAYPRTTSLYFNTPTASGWRTVQGPDCPASADPVIADLQYDEWTGELGLAIFFEGAPVAGQQLTLTYEQDKLFVESGPFNVTVISIETGEVFVVGTAGASDGLITIDIFDANLPPDLESDFLAIVEMSAWLQDDTCASTDAPVQSPGGTMIFVSNAGDRFSYQYESFRCNLEGPSITGEWGTDDLGNPVIHWTIDSGDLIGYSYFDSLPLDDISLVFDCDSRALETVYGEYFVDWSSCYSDEILYDLDSASGEPYRVILTVTSSVPLDYELLSVVNCVSTSLEVGDDWGPLPVSAAQATNGLGGEACYEMFLEPGGDVLSKTVDKPEALPGEIVTYTVEASTSTNMWHVVDLSDTLPTGFEIDPDSITCAVEPAMYQMDPCFVLTDTTLRVQVRSTLSDGELNWYAQGGPVTITLTYQGEITGEPNTTVVNQACSVREFWMIGWEGPGPGPQMAVAQQVEGDQSIIGGGRICTEATTLVLQPDEEEEPVDPVDPPVDPVDPVVPPVDPVDPEDSEDPSEEPEDTEEPATPVEPDLTPASPVTGLPETGHGSANVGVNSLFGAIGSGLLIAGCAGFMVRHRE